ncbi:hypothetical protein KGQ20_39170 [Catenulispora sp. NF23]|uniref:hypothetical protein n=1 Tax=Catenulispora pinistramenti TaxID=2705254 RepID=UPI001BADBF7F|nr:hypothetical protein [Catenulispora pinistramenti]MBS2538785.1 hypothetical protein [Catenulispora pinistramenti]
MPSTHSTRRLLRDTAALLAVGAAALSFTTGPARAEAHTHAHATTTAAASKHHGVKPINGHGITGDTHGLTDADTLSLQTSDTTGAVSPTPTVYLVFWGSQWHSNDTAGVANDLQGMFNGLYGGQDTWGTILTQYCEGIAAGSTDCGAGGTAIQHPASSPLAGVWFDDANPEPDSPAAADIATEAANAAAHFGNTTQDPNDNAQYVIVSASGTHPDGFPNSGFCAWHDQTQSSYGTLAYTNLPYVPDMGAGACTTETDGRMLSGIESTETHEYAETVTDFWPTNGWNNTANGEIGDECENLDAYETLSTGTYDVQGLWSNSADSCVTSG